MTDEQINAAITEAIDADPHWKCAKDYCTDLNAMHEAEKTLRGGEWDTYVDLLADTWIEVAHATARQRAEAFLKTIGKWEEATTEQSSVDHLRDATKMMEVKP